MHLWSSPKILQHEKYIGDSPTKKGFILGVREYKHIKVRQYILEKLN